MSVLGIGNAIVFKTLKENSERNWSVNNIFNSYAKQIKHFKPCVDPDQTMNNVGTDGTVLGFYVHKRSFR